MELFSGRNQGEDLQLCTCEIWSLNDLNAQFVTVYQEHSSLETHMIFGLWLDISDYKAIKLTSRGYNFYDRVNESDFQAQLLDDMCSYSCESCLRLRERT